jgi:hypothetical protein
MRNKAIEYPHPVLNEYTRDYLNSRFAIDVLSHTDNGSEIVIELECQIDCDGLVQTIASGDAKAVLRLTCYRTSLREMYDLNPTGSTVIHIAKKNVTDSVDLQAMIVATRELNKFRLPEFNSDYFGSIEFKIRKGDVLANEPGIKIKLNTMLEKNMAGIVQVRGDLNATNMNVHFAEITEERPDLTDYIVITLPDMDYKNYARMMTKKHLKNGVERFVQASVILPAITEAVGKLRTEETTDGDDGDTVTHYKGTVWADSIYAALIRYGITDLSENQMSDYEIANILLGNVTSDSISNLMQKLTEWSTIREEDPTL